VYETTALGAAYLAGLAVGYWKTPADIDRQWQSERLFEPRMSSDHAEQLMSEWKRAVERSKSWASA
jgi:glycerol kinase